MKRVSRLPMLVVSAAQFVFGCGPDSSGSPAQQLASFGNPTSVCVVDGRVYWASVSAGFPIASVAVSGGATLTVGPGSAGLVSFAVDSTTVYAPRQDDTVVAYAKDGSGNVVVLATNTSTVSVAVANGRAYWIEDGTATAPPVGKSAPVTGGAVETIALPTNVPVAAKGSEILTASDALYAALPAANGIVRIPFDGIATSWIATPAPEDLASDDANLYVSGGDLTLRVVPKNGGTPTTLVSDPALGGALAVDDSSVYYELDGSGGGQILKMPKAGGAPTVLADHQSLLGGLAVDDANVYWAVNDLGAIMKVGK